MIIHKPIEIFSKKMDIAIEMSDKQPGYWLCSDVSIQYLYNQLKKTTLRMDNAFQNCMPVELEKQCVDIANYAMMISDILRGRPDSVIFISDEEA